MITFIELTVPKKYVIYTIRQQRRQYSKLIYLFLG
jgi:hypothetical protein